MYFIHFSSIFTIKNYIAFLFHLLHFFLSKKSIFSNNNLDNISNISAIGKNINTEYLKYNIIRSRDINNEITNKNNSLFDNSSAETIIFAIFLFVKFHFLVTNIIDISLLFRNYIV